MTKIIPYNAYTIQMVMQIYCKDFSNYIESRNALQHNRAMMNQTKYRLMQTLPAFDLQDKLISNA